MWNFRPGQPQLRKPTQVNGRANSAYSRLWAGISFSNAHGWATNLQHWLPETSPEDEPDSPDSYVSVVCHACTRLHFIHKKPGED
jgi:hypothetical protein